MNTPNKNFSPYSSPMQYPSQSADYISLESGGPNKINFKTHQQHKSRGSPYQYNSSHRKPHFNMNQRNFRENNKKFNHNRKDAEYDFSLYFHPSMLQDPWQNLMKRYDSLCASKINLEETPSE